MNRRQAARLRAVVAELKFLSPEDQATFNIKIPCQCAIGLSDAVWGRSTEANSLPEVFGTLPIEVGYLFHYYIAEAEEEDIVADSWRDVPTKAAAGIEEFAMRAENLLQYYKAQGKLT